MHANNFHPDKLLDTNVGFLCTSVCMFSVAMNNLMCCTRTAIWCEFQEQANEREQERDEFLREVETLRRALSDREKKQAAENRLQREVGSCRAISD
jgi:hypothetical protein